MNAKKLKEAYLTGTPWQQMRIDYQILEIKAGITDAMILRGQGRMDNATMEKVADHLNDFINDEFPNLRNKEFGYILNLGISGELGQDTWISGAAVMKWVRMYYRHTERIAMIDKDEADRKTSNRLSPDEIAARNAAAFEESLNKAREYYAIHGTIFGPGGFSLPGWAAQIYNHYKQEGVIGEPTAEQVEAATESAREALTSNGLYAWKYPAEILKTSLADWRDAFLLENYYKNTINPINN